MALSKKYFGAIFFLSMLLHVAMIVLLIFFLQVRPSLNLDRSIVTIYLTKLGKKRDEKLLPRFDASPKVEPIKPEIIQKPLSTRVVSEKIKAPKKKETPQKVANPLDLLNKRFGKPSDEGLEKGSAMGSSLQEDLQDNYTAQVVSLIKQSYTLPAILRNQQNRLTAVIKLRINAQGKLAKVEIIRSSGRAMFDNSVLVTIRKIIVFGEPPLQLRRMIATVGFELEFAP
jgi:TonB family protein